MAKVQISVDEKLLERADKYAEENYMSRSGLVTLSLSQYLNGAEMVTFVRDCSLAMRKIAETGNLSDEDMNKLQDLERVCKLFSGK